MNKSRSNSESNAAGLCGECRHMRRIKSDRGSAFYLCQRSLTNSTFPKYPRLPVVECAGFERLAGDPRDPHHDKP